MKRLIVILFLSVFSLNVMAVEKIPFNKAAFDKAQKEGIPILIDIYADWCPTCERQQNTISSYFKEHPDSKIKIMVIDFDKDKQWVKHFKAPRQSTLYIFQNGEKVWFSVAQTSRRVIHAALDDIKS